MTNLDIIKRLYQLFKEKNYTEIKKIFHDNIRWSQNLGFPNGQLTIGSENVINNVFKRFSDDWENWRAVVENYIDAKSHILVTGFYEGKAKKSGENMKSEFAHLYELEESKIIRFQQYTDTFLIQAALYPELKDITKSN